LIPPGSKRLILKYVEALSKSCFKFNLRRYTAGLGPVVVAFAGKRQYGRARHDTQRSPTHVMPFNS